MSELDTGAAPAAPEGNAVASIPTQVEVVQAPVKTVEDTMSEVFDKFSPPRDDKTQQFTAKTKPETETTVETETAPADTTETEGQAQSETSEPATAIAHPNSLPSELRDKWGTVPPELAKWITERETESHKRITELGQTAKASESIRQVVDRYRATFKGMDPAQAVEKLSAASEFLERDPQNGIKWLADAYGVDLSKLGGGQSSESTEASPEIAALRSEVSQLKRDLAQTSTRVSSREEAERQTHEQSITKLVDDFSKDKPYWAELEDDVFAQIHAIRATDANLPPDKVLDRAYDRASKLNEGVQAKINADKKAEADKKAKAEAVKKAEAAKKAGSVNVKSGQGASPRAKASMEDTMREVADRLMG